MTRRDKDKDPFDDWLDDMDDLMRRMQKEMNKMLDDIMGGNSSFKGYSYVKRPGEEPEYRTFGDEKGFERENRHGHERPRSETSTHVDVLDDDDVIRIIADLPGVEKEDINLTATEKTVSIKASRGNRSYDEEVELPTEVDTESASAAYKNGVLEVTFDKEERTKGKDIEIE
ncbi:MAG: Hsp20/alpha crystallin family protein [Halobacteria archaeon]|nr:Hsp20/alpha crystallin family protein [Halobacteria archaeon]